MINNSVLVGRLTYQPELKSTSTGTSYIRFQIACDRQYQKQGEERKADFIDCIAWRQTAEFISRYFNKGTMIGIEGSIQTENYTDKDGNKRKSVVVNVNQASFVCSKSDGRSGEREDITNDQSAQSNDFEEIVDDDDLPF